LASSKGSPAPRIVLKQGRDAPIRKRHHPWIYSQAVAEVAAENPTEELCQICTSEGGTLGWGLYSPDSLIAVRMVSYGAEKPGDDWIRERIRAAKSVRDGLSLDTDAMRIVNAEGDYLPGLVVDLYGDTVVLSMHTRGIEAHSDRIVAGVRELFPGARIYLRRDEHYARVERLALPSGFLHGEGPATTVIREGEVRFAVDFQSGQKTGFYLDQRANRTLVAKLSRGRNVLNLFSYTGAVSLRALAAGASEVTSVESSLKAIETAQESVRLNPSLQPEKLHWVQEDVFTFLEGAPACDLVVADPPPFARRRAELDGALKGYLALFQQCIRILSPGGVAFLFSCSGAVDRPTFQQTVAEAALRSGRTVRLLQELHADADHPIAAAHPEGEYLKGWMVHAL
jgi:23S rRNA (cytosine1962-C5)-methyltransferase